MLREFQQMGTLLRRAPKHKLDAGFSARVVQSIEASLPPSESAKIEQLGDVTDSDSTVGPVVPVSNQPKSTTKTPLERWRMIAIAVGFFGRCFGAFLYPCATRF